MNGQFENNNSGGNNNKLPPIQPAGLPPIQPINPLPVVRTVQPMPAGNPVNNGGQNGNAPKPQKPKKPKKKVSLFVIIMIVFSVIIAGAIGGILYAVFSTPQDELNDDTGWDDYEAEVSAKMFVFRPGESKEIDAGIWNPKDGENYIELDGEKWYDEPMYYVYKPYYMGENKLVKEKPIEVTSQEKQRLIQQENIGENADELKIYRSEPCVYVKAVDGEASCAVISFAEFESGENTTWQAVSKEEFTQLWAANYIVTCPYCSSVEHEANQHICTVCKNKGHEGGCVCEVCSSKKHTTENHPYCELCNSPNHTKSGHICERCNGKGHNSSSCNVCLTCGSTQHKVHPAEEKPVEKCTICQKTGHTKASHVCSNCGEKGHEKTTCCTVCKKNGHTDSEHICERCSAKGHGSGDCTAVACEFCGKYEHKSEQHICTKCKKTGHESICCPVCSSTEHIVHPEDESQPNEQQELAEKCTLCSKEHKTEEHICSNCGESGHEKTTCCTICKKNGHVDTQHTCSTCGSKEHESDNCCTICRQTGHKAENHVCEKCSQKGHGSSNCNTKACELCLMYTHKTTEHICSVCKAAGHEGGCEIEKCIYCGSQVHLSSQHICSACKVAGHEFGVGEAICVQCMRCLGYGHAKEETEKCPDYCELCIELGVKNTSQKCGHKAAAHVCTKCGKTGTEHTSKISKCQGESKIIIGG